MPNDYDKYKRDPAARKFYNSSAWKRVRKAVLANDPTCQRCRTAFASHVHHVIPLARCTPAQKLDPANLRGLCQPCHNVEEAQTSAVTIPHVAGILTPVEDESYYFDPVAAERPVRFIESLCRHFEGRFAGEPFKLNDWQKQIINTLFGWKRRDNGQRRFKELYLISAKGAGKTPLLAAIGLYMLLADGEAGAHVVSMASSFEQANLTFDCAKKYIAQNPQLSQPRGDKPPLCDVKQFLITGPKWGKWSTISGKPTGRSGPRPTCVIADECHEWGTGTDKAYDMLTANMFKRPGSLILLATNAAESLTSFAGMMHERAARVLAGTSHEPTLLPVIFEAPRSLDWRSEEAARAANPSLGTFIKFDQLRPEQAKGEARYRRLYLSQWQTGADKWIDLKQWDACSAVIDPKVVKDLPLYMGFDSSGGDDLVALVYVWVSADRYYVDVKFYLPKVTADRYEESHRIPYRRWAEGGAITLLDELTINHAVRQRIADDIIAAGKAYKAQLLAFDRAKKADEVVATVEAAGITCVDIPQGWSVTPGCVELESRLTERTLTVAPNPVLRWNAENVEVKPDNKGNISPVKPHAKGRYAGQRHIKIDGISALVTCLVEARKHAFPAAAREWRGRVFLI